MEKKHLMAILAILVIGGSLTSLYFTHFRPQVPLNTKLPTALGQVVAEETAKLLGNKGKIVLLLADTKNYVNPIMNAQVEAFTKALATTKSLTIVATEKVDLEAMNMASGGGEVSGVNPERFLKAIQPHADADAFVSFIGFPHFSQDALAELKGKKFIVVESERQSAKAHLTEGGVQIAIIPRPAPPDAAHKKEPSTPRESFALAYEIVTPATVSSLP